MLSRVYVFSCLRLLWHVDQYMQTTNDIVATSRPFIGRFIEFSLPPYSYEELCEIAVKLADKEMDMIGKLL